MAVGLKEKNIGTLVLVVLVGLLIGGYLNLLVRVIIPGKTNVVETFFTTNIKFGIGEFGDNNLVNLNIEDQSQKMKAKVLRPLVIDLHAIKFQLGFQIRLSFLSLIGLFLSLYFFRWYR